ncbi:MAG: heavy metal translocating P-type ATPase [Candidatus Eisenbacteria bacterium]|nr:heavy metal translocating P-type ATPase [Candidatus Eisenbacteria bacterium]
MILAPALCALFTVAGMLAHLPALHLADWVGNVLYGIACVAGGAQGVVETLASLRRRVFDVNFLMLLAAAGAASINRLQEGAMLLMLFSLSNTLQFFALERTRNAIRALMRLRPEVACVVRDGREESVPAGELAPGDRVRVRPGERLAADGTVAEGTTCVDESAMTGESVPVPKGPGDPVYAGTINGPGSLEFSVTTAAGHTRLARIIELVEHAQAEKAPTQRFIDRFGQYYAGAVLAAVAVTLLGLPLVFRHHFHDAYYRAMVTLVVASPCALVISTPATILSGIAAAARRGILFKGGGSLEAVGKLRVIALDKTGTLTSGHMCLTEAVPAPGRTREELLELASAAEKRSEHPVAHAVLEALGHQPAEATEVLAHAGRGVEARVHGRRVLVGTQRFMDSECMLFPQELVSLKERLEADGHTTVLVADERPLGVLAMADEPREKSAQAIGDLRGMGVKHVVMLTGDHRVVGEAIGRRLGVDEVMSELLPEDKVNAVRELRRRHGLVGMVGDGVNDAPALAAADVGIAMGGRGTDVALETADVVLMSDRIERLPELVDLGRRAGRVVRQNVLISVGVMAGLVGLNFLGWMTLPLGVVGHEGSTLLVVLNGLRLLRAGGPERRPGGSEVPAHAAGGHA